MSGTQSTEDSILNSIPDIESDVSDDTSQSNTDSGTAEASGDEGISSLTTPDAGTAKPNEKPATSSQGNEQSTQATNAQPVVRRDGLIEVPSKDNPNTRDLVDPATGNIVARGGQERAHFERAQRMHHEARVAQQQRGEFERRAITAEAKVSAQNEVMQLAQASGIDHEGHKVAIQLMGRFLKDPVSVLGDLVAEVKAKGYNIPFLEQGISPGMDAQALNRMLDQRLAPVMQERQQQEQQARIQSEAKTTLDNFLAAEPDAVHNIGIIGEMLTREPSLGNNLHMAWSKLIRMAYEAGLDPSQPLGPQYDAKTKQQQPATVAGNPAPALPLPNGRQINTPVPMVAAKAFDANSPMRDIIKHAMRESGYNIQQ